MWLISHLWIKLSVFHLIQVKQILASDPTQTDVYSEMLTFKQSGRRCFCFKCFRLSPLLFLLSSINLGWSLTCTLETKPFLTKLSMTLIYEMMTFFPFLSTLTYHLNSFTWHNCRDRHSWCVSYMYVLACKIGCTQSQVDANAPQTRLSDFPHKAGVHLCSSSPYIF